MATRELARVLDMIASTNCFFHPDEHKSLVEDLGSAEE